MTLPKRVEIVEVGPRDGLQNEPQILSVEAKVELIEALARAGLTRIEAGSFVSSAAAPQMATTGEVLRRLGPRPELRLSVLVPNLRGLSAALAAGAREIAVFAAATESFSKRNINCSIAESLEHFSKVVAEARGQGVRARGYVSCALGCPYEGAVAPQQTAAVARRLYAMGCSEISLGDTIGVGTPLAARALIETVARDIGLEKLAVHFHDTYGQALANIFACLEAGVAVIDSSVGGLGGCPYAPGASGNVATEDVVYMLNGMGVESGVDLGVLLQAGAAVAQELSRAPQSAVARVFDSSKDLRRAM
ncbi:MAG TPA: hydroxymethylglutaryl-CoA lyase [Methylocystis sp.]|nr:hydroxymethylglutaryl-CoA lyase [Methylocystis sp.]